MNDLLPLFDLIPPKYLQQATSAIVLAGIIGRVVTAKKNGSTWLDAIRHTVAGTNTPSKTKSKKKLAKKPPANPTP